MKRPKYYFRNIEDERCYQKEYHLSDAKDEGLTEIEVFEAEPDHSKDHFWCQAIDEACEKEDGTCGMDCEDYEPRNGKSGICKYKSHCFTPGKKVILKPINQPKEQEDGK